MTEEILLYELRVAVTIAAFYLGYRLWLRKETLYAFNRVVLLLTAILSFVLPFCQITFHRTVEMAATVSVVGEGRPVAVVAEAPVATDYAVWALLTIYVLGVLAMLVKTTVSVAGVLRIVKGGRREQMDGTGIVVTDKDVAPFSFLNRIVLSERDWAEDAGYIIAHEREHVRACHTLDVLLTELITALQWFNPAVWLMRNELKDLHEYEADNAVLRHGADRKAYQYLLIKKAVGASGYSVTNSFNHSSIKKRITMMLCKKSSLWSAWKALYIVPLMGLSLASTARTVTDYVVPAETAVSECDSLVKPLVIKRTDKGSKKLAENNPLCLVDGKKVTDISKISPESIESITVLKDEKALEKYGEEGKYGVIIVTLKKGNAVSSTTETEHVSVNDKQLQIVDEKEKPLFVVDGQKVTDISHINPDAIESITVLKGESAVEVFGEKARNSAVVVTLKKGQTDKAAGNDADGVKVLKVVGAKDVKNAGADELKVVGERTLQVTDANSEELPKFQGKDQTAFMEYIIKNIKYPVDGGRVNGTVLASFVVSKNGKVKDVRVVRGLNKACDAEVVRVVSASPAWTPGKKDGKPVDIEMRVPVAFRYK